MAAPVVNAAAPAPAAVAASPRTIVVMGATGRQGGAVIRQLLRHPELFIVVGVTRTPDSAEAKALLAAHPTVTLRKADANDVASLKAAFAGAAGVFGVTNPFAARWTGIGRPVDSVELEDRQGHNIVDACKAAGVGHLVLSTTASAGDKTGIPTFEAKARVEAYLAASGVPHTIIAPVGFLENMESPFAGIRQGVVPGLLKKGIKFQMISVDDIAWFVVNALLHPAAWLGRRQEVAGDRLCAEDMAATLARLRGGTEHWKVSVPPDWVFKLFIPKAVGSLKQFLETKGTHVDVDECRKIHPGLMSFEAWAVARGYPTKKFDAPSMCSVQ